MKRRNGIEGRLKKPSVIGKAGRKAAFGSPEGLGSGRESFTWRRRNKVAIARLEGRAGVRKKPILQKAEKLGRKALKDSKKIYRLGKQGMRGLQDQIAEGAQDAVGVDEFSVEGQGGERFRTNARIVGEGTDRTSYEGTRNTYRGTKWTIRTGKKLTSLFGQSGSKAAAEMINESSAVTEKAVKTAPRAVLRAGSTGIKTLQAAGRATSASIRASIRTAKIVGGLIKVAGKYVAGAVAGIALSAYHAATTAALYVWAFFRSFFPFIAFFACLIIPLFMMINLVDKNDFRKLWPEETAYDSAFNDFWGIIGPLRVFAAKDPGTELIWPIDSRIINSRYGYRTDPFSGQSAFHGGLDIDAYLGQEIYAAAAGKVTGVHTWEEEDNWYINGFDSYGNFVLIDHGNGYRTLYGHCSELLVQLGEMVGRGDLIARAGSTGDSTGPHLHLTVYTDGERGAFTHVDPEPMLHELQELEDSSEGEAEDGGEEGHEGPRER